MTWGTEGLEEELGTQGESLAFPEFVVNTEGLDHWNKVIGVTTLIPLIPGGFPPLQGLCGLCLGQT